MRIPLTAGQAVTIHGWLQPKETLSWMDVLSNPLLTFSFLHIQTGIPKELLHRLQPDITAWVAEGRVRLEDTPSLSQWGAHPIRDLNADLGDIIHMRWPAAVMAKSGVTYSDLVDAGMTHDSMGLFGYTLCDWRVLGFTASDAERLHASALARLFNLTAADVIKCLR